MFALERTCDHQLARHPPDGEGKAIFAVTHIMFDLANLSSNGAFDAAEDDALFDAYFAGRADAALRHSFAAMKAASALREALWAMVSDVHLRTPGVDYKAHAKDYLARFEKLMPA